MSRIDAHQHFWQFDPIRDTWITEESQALRRNFGPADLLPLLQASGIDGSVLVQADQSEEENHFMLAHAQAHDFIRGVVGWVDLRHPEVEERLAFYRQFPKMKGFRHILQSEPNRALMLSPAFRRGIAQLEPFGYHP